MRRAWKARREEMKCPTFCIVTDNETCYGGMRKKLQIFLLSKECYRPGVK
jgi:hypothetical protein